MNVKLTKKPIPTVTVTGEIDHYNAHWVTPAIREATQSGSSIIIDLKEVNYLDSAGVQLIFLASRLVSGYGGRAVLVIKNDNVRRILEITGVDSIPTLEMVSSMATAKKHLEAPQSSPDGD